MWIWNDKSQKSTSWIHTILIRATKIKPDPTQLQFWILENITTPSQLGLPQLLDFVWDNLSLSKSFEKTQNNVQSYKNFLTRFLHFLRDQTCQNRKAHRELTVERRKRKSPQNGIGVVGSRIQKPMRLWWMVMNRERVTFEKVWIQSWDFVHSWEPKENEESKKIMIIAVVNSYY